MVVNLETDFALRINNRHTLNMRSDFLFIEVVETFKRTGQGFNQGALFFIGLARGALLLGLVLRLGDNLGRAILLGFLVHLVQFSAIQFFLLFHPGGFRKFSRITFLFHHQSDFAFSVFLGFAGRTLHTLGIVLDGIL